MGQKSNPESISQQLEKQLTVRHPYNNNCTERKRVRQVRRAVKKVYMQHSRLIQVTAWLCPSLPLSAPSTIKNSEVCKLGVTRVAWRLESFASEGGWVTGEGHSRQISCDERTVNMMHQIVVHSSCTESN